MLSVGLDLEEDGEAEDRYFVALEWVPGKKPLIQTCSREEFQEVLDQLKAQGCEVQFRDPESPTISELTALAIIITEKKPELDVEVT